MTHLVFITRAHRYLHITYYIYAYNLKIHSDLTPDVDLSVANSILISFSRLYNIVW